MANLRLKYIQRWPDWRSGRCVIRHYFRKRGCKRVPLRGEPGSREFMEDYAAATAGQAQQRTLIERVASPGSMNYLRLSYLNSAAFRSLESSTQSVYRNILDRFCEKYGHLSAKTFKRKNMLDLMAQLADKPGSASNFRKAMRAMCRHGVDIELIENDPTRDVKPIPSKNPDGHHSWTEYEINQFRAFHPIGTWARTVFELALCTGQRRSDIVRMSRRDIRDGLLYVKQVKTGAEVWIPILPELQQIIDAIPADQLMLLLTEYGKPFSAAGLGNKFREACNDAGLPHCSIHGLRKSFARRLADVVCTVHEIAAVTGHASLREVQRYTKGADQKRLAVEAMNKLATKVSTASSALTKRAN
jgi:integrase